MKLTSVKHDIIEDQVAVNSLSERLRRGEVMSAHCPSREVLSHITSRWGVLILIALGDGTMRFSELRRKIGGVSEKMLAQTLQALEADGFIDRIAYPVVPPHVEYTLTGMGVEVQVQLTGLTDWVENNLYRIMQKRQSAK
ncbi:winged helix-turn-helix transcriptional regulator [Ewingella americana]|uniref:Transcriptional regulator n=1 Tax=Ewingella americana TaxID=41202 RepID=A0A502GCC3_9GAMM|nr:transcriptional regulator [Ewingella americana]